MQIKAEGSELRAGREVQPSRKVQLIEVSVFLFLFVPSFGASFLLANQSHLRFVGVAISSILSDLALVSLVLYLLWRNGESVRQIGWTRQHLWREIGWGLLLFLPVVSAANLLEQALHAAGLSAPSKLPSFLTVTGLAKIPLAVVLVTVVAVVEETIFRGYLLLRFRSVTNRTATSVLLSSFVFSLGHGYEGLAGVVSVFCLGAVFALVYLWRKSLVAPIVMHFLTDFTSIVLVALLQAKA